MLVRATQYQLEVTVETGDIKKKYLFLSFCKICIYSHFWEVTMETSNSKKKSIPIIL